MGIVDEIKKGAEKNNTKIQTTESANLEKILNKMFYTSHDIEEETLFIKTVMTRGLETQERSGLHCSAIIVSDNKWCLRQQVLSLLFKQIQKENTNVGLLKIFEEGNAIHEKWQRLFIRAGFGKAKTMDRTRLNTSYEVQYSPDIVCRIPEYFDGAMVGEIKSVNTYQFKKMTEHPSARKQLQMYLHFCIEDAKSKGKWNGKDYLKGFVLCEDKNTQEIKTFVYDYDKAYIIPYIERLEEVQYYKDRFLETGKMPKRCKDCVSCNCKKAEECNMKNACWVVGFGRIRL